VKEFDEASAAIPGRKEGVDSVMVDRVKDEPSFFPECVALKEDMGDGPWCMAVGIRCVIPGGWLK
jgi:hypothetical protein